MHSTTLPFHQHLLRKQTHRLTLLTAASRHIRRGRTIRTVERGAQNLLTPDCSIRACAISAAVRPGLIFSVGHIFHMAGSLAITRIQTFHLFLGQRQLAGGFSQDVLKFHDLLHESVEVITGRAGAVEVGALRDVSLSHHKNLNVLHDALEETVSAVSLPDPERGVFRYFHERNRHDSLVDSVAVYIEHNM